MGTMCCCAGLLRSKERTLAAINDRLLLRRRHACAAPACPPHLPVEGLGVVRDARAVEISVGLSHVGAAQVGAKEATHPDQEVHQGEMPAVHGLGLDHPAASAWRGQKGRQRRVYEPTVVTAARATRTPPVAAQRAAELALQVGHAQFGAVQWPTDGTSTCGSPPTWQTCGRGARKARSNLQHTRGLQAHIQHTGPADHSL